MGAAQSIIDDQAQFRVRFTRARGFAALFERPENSYQWSGYGTLSVEPRGIQFRATRRGIGLRRAEARFVAGREISNVYREGDGVRVEFRDDAQQNVLNFWAEDSAAAANIVDQLPTAHTVEVDEAPRRTARSGKRAFRVDLLVVAAGAVAVIAAGAWGTVHLLDRAPDATTTTVSSTSSSNPLPSAVVVSTPDAIDATPVLEAPARAIDAAQLAAMRRDFALFDERSKALTSQFNSAFTALQDGSLSQTDFVDGVERWLLPQWASAARALRDKRYPQGSAREELRTTMVVVTNNWRSGLEGYVSGLHDQEAEQVMAAFVYIGEAEDSLRKARQLAER
jgi:hypothetical protein